jgi:hypothetical protein
VGHLQLVLRGLPGEQQDAQASDPSSPGAAGVAPFTGDTEASKALKGLVGGGAAPSPAKSHGGATIHINRAGQISAEGGLK